MNVVEIPRLASIDENFWELESGEARHGEVGDSFEIPDRAERESLTRGDAAKLLFWIDSEDDDGNAERQCERMWVVVKRSVADFFLGVLSNEPSCLEPGTGSLGIGTQVWFRPEHVIDIDHPDAEDVKRLLGADFFE